MKTNTFAVKRILAMVLSVALMLTGTPTTALTAYAQDSGACTHTHDEACGYVEGAECDHVHDESCGEDGVDCAHDCNDGDCGYIAAAPCKHEHDEDCGGGLPTTPEDTGENEPGENNDPATPGTSGSVATPTDIVVLGFSTPAVTATVPLGTSYGDLPLPETVNATVDGDADPADIPVEWTDDDSYDGDTPGDYGFTGDLGEGYILAGVAAGYPPAGQLTYWRDWIFNFRGAVKGLIFYFCKKPFT